MEAVEIETGSPPQAAVVWLHGLGADGHDFEPIVPELRLKKAVRFVFPHAPVRPVTINQGMRMRAWYDILQFGGGPEDDKGIRASQGLIDGLIASEVKRGIPEDKIVVAGFSQGGAIALQTALRYPKTLAGVMALSTYLPLHESLATEAAATNRKLAIFMAHGTQDGVVPYELGARSRDLLVEQGYAVEWHEYPMQHSVCAEEVAAIGEWLRRVLRS